MLSLRVAYEWALGAFPLKNCLRGLLFLMQPPELFKMMHPEEEDDEELPSSSFSGLALCSYCKSRNGLCGSDIHLEGKRAAELSELTRTLRACLRKLTRPSPFSFPKSAVSEAFVVLVKVATAPRMSSRGSHSKFCWFCFRLVRPWGLRRLPAAKVSGQVAKLD